MSSRKNKAKRAARRSATDFGAEAVRVSGRVSIPTAPTAVRVASRVIVPSPITAARVATAAPAVAAYRPPAANTVAPAVDPIRSALVVVPSKAPYIAPVAVAPSTEVLPYSPLPNRAEVAYVPPPNRQPIAYVAPSVEAAYVPPSRKVEASAPARDEVIDVEWEAPGTPTLARSTPAMVLTDMPKSPVVPSSPNPRIRASLFARFMGWLGFTKIATMHGDPQQTRMQAAASLVRRARCGDQNAMAIIDVARVNAAKGSLQAKLGVEALQAYIKANPAGADMAGENDGDPSYRAAMHLADGPYLSTARISRGTAHYGSEEVEAFRQGFRNARNLPPFAASSPNTQALQAGKTVGIAKRLQNLRLGAPLKEYDTDIGWEIEG